MSTPKKILWSTEDGTAVRLTLENGGVAIVGGEDQPAERELPAMFHRVALANFCIRRVVDENGETQSETTVLKLPETTPANDLTKRRLAIIECMKRNVRDGTEGFLTAAGVPNAKTITKELGFDVLGPERDDLWAVADKQLREEAEELDRQQALEAQKAIK